MGLSMSKKKNEDRISHLPDALLHHILSSLNTKQVVQTCVLSKRWKTLWTHIPTLNFDFNSYPFKEYSSSQNPRRSKQSSFKNFIFRILSEHCSNKIQKLRYTSSKNEEEVVLVELLICYARCHNVRELYIDTCSIGYYDWKCCLLPCSSLNVLKIAFGFEDNWGVLALPSLRILEIEFKCDSGEYVHLPDYDYDEIRIFSGCPNLKSLVLIDYYFESATICAPNLENLELCVSTSYQVEVEVEVELTCASSLKSVTFTNILPTVRSASEFSCIQKVNIQFHDYVFTDGSNCPESIAALSELLRVFHNASSFTLPLNATQQAISSIPKGLSFHNMRHLELKAKRHNKKRIDLPTTELAYLLNQPNLKTFAILDEDDDCCNPTIRCTFDDDWRY